MSDVGKKSHFNDVNQDPSGCCGRTRAARGKLQREEGTCAWASVQGETRRPEGQGQLGRITVQPDHHCWVVRAETSARVTRWGGHTCFSSDAMGPQGVVTCLCKPLLKSSKFFHTHTHTHTRSIPVGDLWPPPSGCGRLLALGEFCYELIKLTLSS